MSGHRSSVRRFASKEIESDRSVGLMPGHPALSEGRTIFPSTVVASKQSPRFLVSGHNNPKLGKAVLKGPRTGWPIYQLSLEERATCPRSCAVWSECYGNAVPYARRHTPDADFLRFLIAEVTTACRAHPEGLLIRLHTLGDFYSVEYVYVWASLIAQFPQLHVFGYTARRVGDDDPGTDRIARAISVLTESAWDRFAIRTSGVSEARSRSIVVDRNPERPDVIVCPAQTSDTEACASCGLCWAGAARDKTIAFLKHGMKARAPKAANDQLVPEPAPEPALGTVRAVPALVAVENNEGPALGRRAGETLAALQVLAARQGGGTFTASHAEIAAFGVPSGSLGYAMHDLEKKGLLQIVSPGRGKRRSEYRLTGGLKAVAPATPPTVVPAAPGWSRPAPAISIRTKVNRDLLAPSADDLPAVSRPSDLPRGLIARKPGQCAYPTNSPAVGRGEETTFCCDPVMGKLAYCEAHARAMWPGRKGK